MKKTLVVYFSASGTIAQVANKLAQALDSDLYEIKPAVPYTKADLNWMDKKSRSSKEMSDKSSRPAIIKSKVEISQYNTILLDFQFGGARNLVFWILC